MEFEVLRDETTREVPWISVDPHPSPEMAEQAATMYPRFFNGPPALVCIFC